MTSIIDKMRKAVLIASVVMASGLLLPAGACGTPVGEHPEEECTSEECGSDYRPYCHQKSGQCQWCLDDSHCQPEFDQCVDIEKTVDYKTTFECMHCTADPNRCGKMDVCRNDREITTFCENGVPVFEYEEWKKK